MKAPEATNLVELAQAVQDRFPLPPEVSAADVLEVGNRLVRLPARLAGDLLLRLLFAATAPR